MNNWSTKNEIEFIGDMVSGKSMDYKPSILSMEQLLKNYIKCAIERKRNGRTPLVDWDKCIDTAEFYLKEFGSQ